jgi:sugar lactone lactonase YvrE
VAFNTDGTKMFVVGQVGSTIYEYNLATGFNISTASYSQNFSLSSQETGAQDVAFNTDGTKMFIVGTSGQDVNEYTLSTGFDVSSASYSQNFSVSSQDTIPTGITFNTDGTSMFITGQTNDKVFEYTLTSGFDVSTASYSSTSFSVLSEESNPLGLVFNSNGTKMFITGTTGDDVNEYSTTAASTTVPAGKALSATSINLDYTT